MSILLGNSLGNPDKVTTTTGSGQSANINTAFTTALQATVLDPSGTPLPNVTVSFDAPASGASGLFQTGGTTAMVTTNASGIATAPTFTANGTAGSYSVTASASNGSLNVCTTFSLTNIACPTITLSPTTLPNAMLSVAYSQTVTASGGNSPYTFSLSAGSLPSGLSLASSGLISGTPTLTGTSNFTVMTTDANGCTATMAYSLTVVCQTITLSPTSLPNGQISSSYSQTISASGGIAPYTFAVTAGSLPNSLSLSTGGQLSGTFTQSGTFNFTVTAMASNGCIGSQAYSLTVNCGTLTINPTSLPAGTFRATYTTSLSGSGGVAPYSFSPLSGSLPAGMTLNANGTFTGLPNSTGIFTFTVKMMDGAGCSATKNYSLKICSSAITLSALPTTFNKNSIVNNSITASGGTAPIRFSVLAGTIPTGLSLSMGGLLSGTPTTLGTFTFTVKATDSQNCIGTRSYTITIR